ncbi:MAG: TRAP transporter large permease [Candidatus Pelethousia sp.]|nr:TRAP transporter large permease [Candidatus Pelethousia sp.]
MISFVIIVMFVLLGIGAPIAVSMGLASMLGIAFYGGSNFVAVGQRVFEGMNGFALLAIPLYTFAGLIMGTGGIGRRLIDFSYSLVGHIQGGLAHVNVVTSMIFAGMSGSAAADTAYESALIMPPMLKKGYSKEFIVGVTAMSSTIGIILPPSIPMVVIAGALGLSTGKIFLGGIIPGILCGISQMIISYFWAKKEKIPKEEGGFQIKRVFAAFKESFWALLMPVLTMVFITTGFVSPTEAGLIAAVYGLVVGGLVYKELKWKDIKAALMDTAKTSGKVFIIIGSAGLLGKVLTTAGFHTILANFLLSITREPTLMLLIIMVIMIIISTFMECISTIVLLMPMLYPVALEVGIDPIVLSVLVVVCMGIGLVTPPEGMCLYLAADFAKLSISRAVKGLMPFMIGTLVVILILVAFPALITWPASFIS